MLKHWVVVSKQSYSLLSYVHPKDPLDLFYLLKNTATITFYCSWFRIEKSMKSHLDYFCRKWNPVTKPYNYLPNYLDLIILEIQKTWIEFNYSGNPKDMNWVQLFYEFKVQEWNYATIKTKEQTASIYGNNN